jgi:hypothetical protein
MSTNKKNQSAAGGGGGVATNGTAGTADDFHDSMSSLKGFDHRIGPIGADGGSDSAFDYSPTRNSPRRTVKKGVIGPPGISDGDPNGDGKNNMGIELQLLPPGQRPGLPNDLLASVIEPEIEDNTEAAEALRANASIKVGKMGKVARSVNAQTVRKLFKTATLRGHGPKRGKPPRVPPGTAAGGGNKVVGIHYTGDELHGGDTMYAPQDGDYETSERRGADDDFDSGSDSDDDENSIVDVGGGGKVVDGKVHDGVKEESDRINETDDPNLLAKYNQEDTTGLFETDATDSTTKRKSRSDNYTHVMTGEGQRDIPTEVVADTMETGKKCKHLVMLAWRAGKYMFCMQ